jgi:hypothetical protein
MKPNLFIGSSTEGLKFAYALHRNLDRDAQVTVWTQNVFQPGSYVLESLAKALVQTDFGAFIFSMDDVVTRRGEAQPMTRDNVVFELGLFMGKLGRQRSIIVEAIGKGGRLPSDFMGVTVSSFDAERSDENWTAALGPASDEIRQALARIAPAMELIPNDMTLSLVERYVGLNESQRKILGTLETVLPAEKPAIVKQFPELSRGEIDYRLEQLRLLMFITVDREKVDLTEEYKRTMEKEPFRKLRGAQLGCL